MASGTTPCRPASAGQLCLLPTLHTALSVGRSVHHTNFLGFCGLWPHCSCQNFQVTSDTAPAHSHATGVAVNTALLVNGLIFKMWLVVKKKNYGESMGMREGWQEKGKVYIRLVTCEPMESAIACAENFMLCGS